MAESGASDTTTDLRFLDVVELTAEVIGDEGTPMPPGTQGTIIERFSSEAAFMIDVPIIDGERWETATVDATTCRLFSRPEPPPPSPRASVSTTTDVGSGIRLVQVVQTDRHQAMGGLLLPAGLVGTIISRTQSRRERRFVVSFRLPSGSIYGYSVVRATVLREDFELAAPADADSLQDPTFPK